MGIPDLAQIHDKADLTKALEDIVGQERAVQIELEQRLLHRQDLETELLSLTASVSDVLQLGQSEAAELAGEVRSAATRAEQVSKRVRRLDTARANVSSVLEKLEVIMECSECIAAIRSAMAEADHEAAAAHIERYRALDLSATYIPPSTHASMHAAVVQDAQERLLTVVREQTQKGLETQDAETAVRFLQLYQPLDMPNEGMSVALAFLQGAISKAAAESNDAVNSGLAKDSKAFRFVGPLSFMLKAAFSGVKRFQPIVREAFGPQYVAAMVMDVAKSVGEKGPPIIQRFFSTRGVPAVILDVSTKGASATTDALHADTLLGELRDLLACCQDFTAFLLRTAADALLPKPVPAPLLQQLRTGEFGRACSEVESAYSQLECYYLERSLRTAIQMDTLLPGALMSSMLDDSLFVLKQALTRALSTGSSNALVAVLAAASAQLQGPFQQAIVRGAADSRTALVAAFAGGVEPSADALEAALVGLNNVALGEVFVGRLHQSLDTQAVQKFGSSSDAEGVRAGLAGLKQATSSLQALSGQLSSIVAETIITDLLQKAASTLNLASYTLNEAQYAALEHETGWARQLATGLKQAVEAIQPALASEAQQELMRGLLSSVLTAVDTALSAKKFTLLGGLLLDRDIRVLTGALAEITGQPVRERCTRLAQMVDLLMLESLSEAETLWQDSSIVWRLSPVEAKSVLRQRVDLDAASITALPL